MPVTRHPPRRSVLALLTHTAPRSDQLRRSEALRTAIGPCDTSSPAQCRARARPHDVLLAPRPSLPSLRRRFPLFVRWFTGTMAWSDSSATYMSAVRLSAFSDRSRSERDIPEVSRFSCMLFLDVLRFLDYAGPDAHSRSNANAPAGKHSEKPQEFYELVDALCPGSKLDVFARERRDGWESYGHEVQPADRSRMTTPTGHRFRDSQSITKGIHASA